MHIAVSRNGASPVTLLTLSIIALALAPESLNLWLALDREAICRGELWRLWTAHAVHFSAHHALIDALVLFLVGTVMVKMMGRRWVGCALVVIAPAISLGLLTWSTELAQYRGMSGLATAMTVATTICMLRVHMIGRPVFMLLAVAMFFKAIGDATGNLSDFAYLPDGVMVEWRAHALGAFIGTAVIFSDLPDTALLN